MVTAASTELVGGMATALIVTLIAAGALGTAAIIVSTTRDGPARPNSSGRRLRRPPTHIEVLNQS